jgi:hypothetical protein
MLGTVGDHCAHGEVDDGSGRRGLRATPGGVQLVPGGEGGNDQEQVDGTRPAGE